MWKHSEYFSSLSVIDNHLGIETSVHVRAIALKLSYKNKDKIVFKSLASSSVFILDTSLNMTYLQQLRLMLKSSSSGVIILMLALA